MNAPINIIANCHALLSIQDIILENPLLWSAIAGFFCGGLFERFRSEFTKED